MTMVTIRITQVFLLVALCCQVQASSYGSPLVISPAIPSFRARGRRSQQQHQSQVLLAARNKKKKSPVVDQEPLVKPVAPVLAEDIPKWEDLPLGWKAVFGAVEVGYTVVTQYVSGFATAYILGSLTGIPVLAKAPTDGLTRFARFHQKNMRWGKNWGQISASFSGFDTGVRLLRDNKQDEWNSLFGSACAGAFFVRNQGPGSMAKSALLYAAFGYFFMRAGQKNEVFVEEQPL